MSQPEIESEDPAESGSSIELRDLWLAKVRDDREPINVYLLNGVKLQGIVTRFDARSIVFLSQRSSDEGMLIERHGIATMTRDRGDDGGRKKM